MASSGARQALLDYSQEKIDADAVMRALVEHPDWHVPIHALGRPAPEERIVYEEPGHLAAHQLNVFLDRASADQAAEQFGRTPMGTYVSGVQGAELFANLRQLPALEPVKTLQVNPGSPTPEQWYVNSEAFKVCEGWSRAIRLEQAIIGTSAGWADAMRQFPSWLAIVGRADNALVKIHLRNKGEHALLFTATDRATHFLAGLQAEQRAGCQLSIVAGDELFGFLQTTAMKGFLVNANSPQTRVFEISVCRMILGQPQG